MIDPVKHSPESVYEVAKCETEMHRRGHTFARGGQAGPPQEVLPLSLHFMNGSWHSPITKSVMEFIHKRWKVVSPYIHYIGKLGKSVITQPMANIAGTTKTKDRVRKLMKESKHYREQRLVNQFSRLRCQVFAATYQIPQHGDMPARLDNGNSTEFWGCFNNAWENYLANKEKFRTEWHAVDPNLTEFDVILLEYIVMTGEVMNFQPMPSHMDSSKGLVFETLDMVGLLSNNESRTAEEVAAALARDVGQIMAPLQGAALELAPGNGVLHANFSGTVHVPDSNRGTTNLSRVSWSQS